MIHFHGKKSDCLKRTDLVEIERSANSVAPPGLRFIICSFPRAYARGYYLPSAFADSLNASILIEPRSIRSDCSRNVRSPRCSAGFSTKHSLKSDCLVNRFRRNLRLVLQRTDALLARVVWNVDFNLADIVTVIQLRELVTEAVRISGRARLT